MKPLSLLTILFFIGCATYKPQYTNKNAQKKLTNTTKELAHSFYLIGDAGNSPLGKSSATLKVFTKELENASKNTTTLFLGDNIYENGFVSPKNKNYKLAKHRIKIQTDAVKKFKGQPIFIPGNHDWYSGLKGLKRQENFVEKQLGKNSFLPENGCPIDKIHISKNIELIIIDSHWYMTTWDKHPTINDNCEIKTRADFFNEFKSLIKKNRGKTTIIALHHPIYTNGPHGGQFTFKDHMKPLPVVGTVKNILRSTTGITNTDIQNKRYNEFRKRFITIAQENKKVILISGHEHSLQYIIQDNLHQIISGSGSKKSATRNKNGQFSYGTSGYARLDVYKDGSSNVEFFSVEDNKPVYATEIFSADKKHNPKTYTNNFPATKKASVYTEKEAHASGMKKFLWGKRYRKYYKTPVEVPTVNLDTMFGGLTPVRKGGGNQSKSLRLKDKNGTQYVMRALHKNAVQYLQAVLFKDQYIGNQFDGTKTEGFLLDVFAGSHPYAPFVIGDLSDAVGVFHTNPTLYYIPKQKALGAYNNDFGDELYMIEEHTSAGHGNKASFGFQNKLVSTGDMMKKVHKNENTFVDEASYIRARLFDMLIGDWDRHHDQWRWIEFKENGKKIYRPMPRDRDQAFSIMSDGALLGVAVKILPVSRLLRKYDDDLVDVKGVNVEPYPIDIEIIQQSGKDVWDAQVKRIQTGLTDDVIDKAFLNFPKEVRGVTTNEIKRKLKGRRKNLQKIADRYFKYLNKYLIIKGTNKDDWFDIERLPNGKTTISVYRIKKGKKKDLFHQRTYNKKDTKEIWIYGLDDDDMFHVFGNTSDNEIKIRLIGGQNNDTYNIKNGKSVTYYDYASKKNTFITHKGKQKLTDAYKVNVYSYKKIKNNITFIGPSLGYNPDDGFKAGINFSSTNNGFERNPFTAKHIINANYFFATKGAEINYSGEFANIFQGINFGIDTKYNTPNYATNFFGFGNNSLNPEADGDDGLEVNRDYNRVKIRTFKIAPSLIWRGELGSEIKASFVYEMNKVERTQGRFIETLTTNNPVFGSQNFIGLDATYQFENKNNNAFPTRGFQFKLHTGYKNNTKTNKSFGYINPLIGFNFKLAKSEQIVLATQVNSQFILGNNFEFYQGANIGANNGLRGYRKQRFIGKSAFTHSTDIRWNFTNLKTNILPIYLGMYGGVDYGRVWFQNDPFSGMLTSYGGGVFLNIANMMTANVSAFTSDDGVLIGFKMGFGF